MEYQKKKAPGIRGLVRNGIWVMNKSLDKVVIKMFNLVEDISWRKREYTDTRSTYYQMN